MQLTTDQGTFSLSTDGPQIDGTDFIQGILGKGVEVGLVTMQASRTGDLCFDAYIVMMSLAGALGKDQIRDEIFADAVKSAWNEWGQPKKLYWGRAAQGDHYFVTADTSLEGISQTRDDVSDDSIKQVRAELKRRLEAKTV